MKKLNIVSWASIVLLSIFVFSACANNEQTRGPKDEGNIILTIPQSGLFGITNDDEKAIKEIAILVFNTSGNLLHQPIYVNADQGVEVGDELRFDIELQPRGYSDIMVLGNSEDVCRNAIDATKVGLPREDIMALLKFETAGKWDASSSIGYKPIPMWGSTGVILIAKNTLAKMKLVRMLASLDLDIPTQSVADDLKLLEIQVYNTNDAGQIIPAKNNWDLASLVVTEPTIPAVYEKNLPYLAYTEITNNKSCIGEIYLFEASNALVTDPLKIACIVLKARYKTDLADTYYAVLLEKRVAGVVVSGDILRNHKYKVNIVEVSGSGWETPEEALKNGNANIKTTIEVWDDGKFSEGVIDGQNEFKVSKGNFLLSRDAHTAADTENKVTVFSNEASGWKVSKIADAAGSTITWLSIEESEKTGLANQPKEISLLLDANTAFVNRVGYIHFSAGHLEYKLKVTQTRGAAKLIVDKNLFDDPEGLGIGTGAYYSNKIDSLFNITSNTSWEIVSSHPTVLSVDKNSGTGDSQIKIVLQPSALLVPKNNYTLTITGVGADYPVVIPVRQFGLDIYLGNDGGTTNRAMPNARFIAACKAHSSKFDGGDGNLSISEAVAFDGKIEVKSKSITSLKGVEYFRNITALDCSANQLTELDVSKNVNLTSLGCAVNQLTELDVRQNVNLTILDCHLNQLTELDVRQNVNLTFLNFEYNQLTELDVRQNVNLTFLRSNRNQLISLDVSKNLELTQLECYINQLSELDVRQNVNLTFLYCSINQLTELDVSKNVNLTNLLCSTNQLTELDVRQNVNLMLLDCGDNQLAVLDVTKNVELGILHVPETHLTSLDVTKNIRLQVLNCEATRLTTLDLSKSRSLTDVYATPSNITTVYVWWVGGGAAGKPNNWTFPAGFTNYEYRP